MENFKSIERKGYNYLKMFANSNQYGETKKKKNAPKCGNRIKQALAAVVQVLMMP